MLPVRFVLATLILLCSAGAADAQRGARPRPATDAARAGATDLSSVERHAQETDRAALQRAARRAAARGYTSRDVLASYDRDRAGRWFKRGEILIATADPSVFATAARLGLSERRRTRLESASVDAVTYAAPDGTDMEAALAMLRRTFPAAAIDLNYVYLAQGDGAAVLPPAPAQTPLAPPATVAVIDGALEAPPSPRVSLTKRRFADGAPVANGHAPAVAAIFAHTANAETLRMLAADVVSAGPIESAAADDIARALDWAALEGAGVINVSLTGPPSMTLDLVARAVAARGSVIVAAAGNDGPRAPAPYPAALADAIGVTAVDDRGRIWRRATRGSHVDFAARGVRITLDGGRRLTGTSFAAPVVSGLLARRLPEADANRARAALRDLEVSARDLGAPGRDPVYGVGLLEAP